jgi:ribonucleotide reductase beta subunit family protein with ferritin-like domain
MSKINRAPEELSFYPISNQRFHDHYVELRDSRWLTSELDFSGLAEQWKRIDKPMAVLIKAQLAFLSQFDNLVCLQCDFFRQRTSDYCKEIGYFYIEQASNELIHSEVYSKLIMGIFQDPEIHGKLLNSIGNIPVIRRLADWVMKYMSIRDESRSDEDRSTNKRDLLKAVVAFCCLEGIIFSFSFCVIFLLKRSYQNILPAVSKSNEWIAADENKHRLFGSDVYKYILDKELTTGVWKDSGESMKKTLEEDALSIVQEANKLVSEFIDYCFEEVTRETGADGCDRIEGISKQGFGSYLNFISDDLLSHLGYNPHWGNINPFIWMKVLSVARKSNIHEVEGATEYSGFSCAEEYTEKDFNLDEEPDF